MAIQYKHTDLEVLSLILQWVTCTRDTLYSCSPAQPTFQSILLEQGVSLTCLMAHHIQVWPQDRWPCRCTPVLL